MEPDLAALKNVDLSVVEVIKKNIHFSLTLQKISGTWTSNLSLLPSVTPKNLISQLKWGPIYPHI